MLLLGVVVIVSFVVGVLLRASLILEKRAATPAPVLAYPLDDPSPRAVSQRTFRAKDVAVDFSLVIPCFNEAARITTTLQTTTEFFNGLIQQTGNSLTYEMIIMDDGSSDATIEVVQNFAKYTESGDRIFRIFKLERNCGKGVAVKEGFLRSRGALCLFMDADGATEISDVSTLHEQLLQLLNLRREDKLESGDYRQLAEQLGVIVGSRAHLEAKAKARRSSYRNFLMHGFHALVWVATWTPVRDTQCGFKLFTRAAVDRIFPHVKIRRWCFDVEVLFLAKKNQIPIGEVPVRWTEIPGSKMKFYHIAHMAWELGMILFGYTFLPSWKTWKTIKSE